METNERQKIEQPELVQSDSEGWQCRSCGVKLSSELFVCPNDGTTQSDVGERLSKSYEILQEIDRGGMGLVYKARHKAMNGMVAIKMMRTNRLDESTFRRFEQEAKVISGLDHPGIVRLRDFGATETGQPYMVLDYVDGTSLAQAVELRGVLPVDESLDIFIQVCNAVEHAHLKRILHRDIKPSNIMIARRPDGKPLVKILDFGIAKTLEFNEQGTLTKTGEVFGSPRYMSPEQASGKSVDQRADIYSLGIVMFEMLTGKHPYGAADGIEVITDHITKPAPSLRSFSRSVPASLEPIVAKALAKNPDERFQSMSQLKNALLSVRKGEDPALAQKKQGRLGRREFALMGGALVAVAILGVGVWNAVKPLDAPISPSAKKTVIEAYPTIPGEYGTTAKQALAQQYLGRKVNLVDYNAEITDDDLAVFDQSVETKDFTLQGAIKLKGKGLAHLIHLNLTALNLTHTPVPERAMAEIGRMTHLKYLDLTRTDVTDRGLTELCHLKDLTHVKLGGEHFLTNNGLVSLEGLDKLQTVNLSKNRWISSDGLAHVRKLPKLDTLRLSYSGIKDGDLSELQSFKTWVFAELCG